LRHDDEAVLAVRLDLNLLRVFDALYIERSVTRAAVRLHLTQPAVSNALVKLREHYGDPLFVRAKGGVAPTPRAIRLASVVREALRLIENTLVAEADFDPLTSDAVLSIAATAFTGAVILPPLATAIRKHAPNMRIHVQKIGHALEDATQASRNATLVLCGIEKTRSAAKLVPLFEDDWVVVARRNHPRIGRHFTIEEYCNLPHALNAPDPHTVWNEIDVALAKLGHRRSIALVLPVSMSTPGLSDHNDLVASFPRRIGVPYAKRHGLVAHTLPFEIPPARATLLWQDDPARRGLQQWAIDLVQRVCATL
jgi:DNA-binding transcriptional LysR family regulator